MEERQFSYRRILWECALAGLLSLLAVCAVLKIHHLERHSPLHYEGDGVQGLVLIKNMIETGWFSTNERFGAGGGMDLHEFPMPDLVHFGFLWMFAQAIPEPPVVFNAYYLTASALAGITMVWLLRGLGVGTVPAITFAVLFANLPFHFMRLSHLFFASYWTIPLGAFLVLRFGLGQPVRWPSIVAIAIVTGLSGVYYAFFTCFFLAVAAVVRCVAEGGWRPAVRPAATATLIFAALLAALAPSLLYQSRASYNPDATTRSPGDSESLALKMMQIITPVPNHRIPKLADFKLRYDRSTPLNNENRTACLGMTFSLGFLYLLARAIFFRRNPPPANGSDGGGDPSRTTLDFLATLTLTGFLFGSIGAFGSAFSFGVSPWIRAYNRISIFLGMFSVIALAILCDRWLKRISPPKLRALAYALMPAFGLSCVWEQTTPGMVPAYEWVSARYHSDEKFIGEIEACIEPGRLVYEMPYRPFPEAAGEAPGIKFAWYDLMRPLVHSQSLTWSFGVQRGRYGDIWIQRMEQKNLEERLLALADIRCAGVLLFRDAYEDRGNEIEGKIAALARTGPIVSPDKGMAFYPLDKLSAERLELLGPEEAAKILRQELYPVLPLWGLGAGAHSEMNDYTSSRFCQSGAELRLANRDTATRKVRLRLEVRLKKPHPDAFLTLRDGADNPRFPITDVWTTVEQDFTVPPGEMLLHVDCGNGNHFDVLKAECVDQ